MVRAPAKQVVQAVAGTLEGVVKFHFVHDCMHAKPRAAESFVKAFGK